MEENNLQEQEETRTVRSANADNKEKKPKKEKKPRSVVDTIISIIILCVCIAGLIYSGSKLLTWLKNNITSNKVITQINDIAGVPNIGKDENPGAEFGIDFEALCAYNPDIVGWIRIPGTSVSYSICQATDNNKYLRHSVDLTWNEFGWPFMDYKNASDFTDKNTVIYGHNIVSGLMFADLSYIYNGILGNDVEIDIYRKDYRLLRYKVFSTYIVDPEIYYTTTAFKDNESYSEFLNIIKNRSSLMTNQTVGVEDNVLTLSTCTSDAKRRIVVHAKLVSNEPMPR